MPNDPLSIVQRYHAALNAFDPAVITPLMAPEAEYHSPSVGVIAGRDQIISAMRGYFAEYGDQVAADDKVELVKPNVVRCEWRLKATAKSTGEPYERRGIEHVTLTPDGLILRVEVQDL